jgi:hypothetical protein
MHGTEGKISAFAREGKPDTTARISVTILVHLKEKVFYVSHPGNFSTTFFISRKKYTMSCEKSVE